MQAMGTAVEDAAYRALFESNPHPMWVFERSTLRFLAVNDAALRQYGYSREEFLNLTILDIRPEEDAALVQGSVETSLSAPKIWCHRRKDRSTLLAEITAHNLEFMGVDARLVLALDVSLRERQSELLRRCNQTLEAVIQAAPVGVLVFDAQGGVTHTNETARRLLGEEGLAPVLETVRKAGESAEVEVAQGRWAEVAVQSFEVGPGSNGTVVVLTETTERRAHQGRLSLDLQNRTAALKASDEELDGFCFSVSHDLRGPLRAIDGFAQLVLSDGNVALNEENRDALERVRRAAKRMGELIDGLLVLSRLVRAPFEPQEVDLSAIARRTLDGLARDHPRRRVHFDVEPNLRAFGDPRLVAVLVEQLLENAVKFTGPRDEACIEFLSEGEGWAVRDDGVGFDMAYASHLFKPFERLHRPNDFPGNGLGLAIAQRIVRRHGGAIEAESSPGNGATFRFTLAPGESS